jgi:hypothetical protein
MRLIGNELWYDGYRVATLDPDMPHSVRETVERRLDPGCRPRSTGHDARNSRRRGK